MNGRGEDGGASVETALVLPVIATILFAIIQFGLAFYEWQGLQAAAREGARLATYSGAPSWSAVDARVREAASEVQGGTLAVETWDATSGWTVPAATDLVCDGLTSEVRLRARYVDDYPLEAIFFTASVPMSAEAVFRCENAP